MPMIPPTMIPPKRKRLVPFTTGLSLSQLESIALESNPTLVQARAQVEASLSKSLQAGLMPNPVMGYVSEQMGAGGGPGETQGGFIEQEIYRGGKLRLSRARVPPGSRPVGDTGRGAKSCGLSNGVGSSISRSWPRRATHRGRTRVGDQS